MRAIGASAPLHAHVRRAVKSFTRRNVNIPRTQTFGAEASFGIIITAYSVLRTPASLRPFAFPRSFRSAPCSCAARRKVFHPPECKHSADSDFRRCNNIFIKSEKELAKSGRKLYHNQCYGDKMTGRMSAFAADIRYRYECAVFSVYGTIRNRTAARRSQVRQEGG